jgi:hypothetical protein
VADIKNIHQEINKHLTLLACVNQAVSYCLLPLFTETMQLEDRGMICNIACPASASKLLKTVNTAKLVIEMQVLSD